MEQFKRATVIILPTETPNKLVIDTKLGLKWNPSFFRGLRQYQHLYIVSDEEIKEGDWCIVTDKNSVLYGQFEQHRGSHLRDDKCKKIIATTDTSLKISKFSHYSQDLMKVTIYKNFSLPQLSQQFIEKYVESYNTGKTITEVLVEYEREPQLMDYKGVDSRGDYEWYCPNCRKGGSFMGTKDVYCYNKECCNYKLKVNPKDNAITTKKLKASWCREEVIDLLSDWTKTSSGLNINLPIEKFNKWVEENL